MAHDYGVPKPSSSLTARDDETRFHFLSQRKKCVWWSEPWKKFNPCIGIPSMNDTAYWLSLLSSINEWPQILMASGRFMSGSYAHYQSAWVLTGHLRLWAREVIFRMVDQNANCQHLKSDENVASSSGGQTFLCAIDGHPSMDGKTQRLACKQYLRDWKRAKRKLLVFRSAVCIGYAGWRVS